MITESSVNNNNNISSLPICYNQNIFFII